MGVMGKVSGRFLLQLNVLDELGFSRKAFRSDYAGNPHLSHYAQFDATLRQLGISAAQADAYVPSECRGVVARRLSKTMTTMRRLTGGWRLPRRLSRGSRALGEMRGRQYADRCSTGYHSIHVEKDGHS